MGCLVAAASTTTTTTTTGTSTTSTAAAVRTAESTVTAAAGASAVTAATGTTAAAAVTTTATTARTTTAVAATARPTTAVTATARITTAATKAACAWRTCFHRTGFVHDNAATTQRLAIHAIDGCLRFSVAAHFHKAKAFRTASVTFHHDFSAGNRAKLTKRLLQVFVANRVRQIANVKFVAH